MTNYMSMDETRVNWLGSLYADIAVENYYLAKCKYEQLIAKDFEFYDDIQDGYETAIKYAITTVVFSAMAIEALINDFAATAIGDKTFRESFDKLSVVDKLCLIVRFVFHKPFDKSGAYYSGLVELFRCRNKYVHPKTKYATEAEQMDYLSLYEYDPLNPYAGINAFEENYRNESIERIHEARDALKTIYNVTKFFDENDQEALATLRLLIPQIIVGDRRTIMKAKKAVYPELGIKLETVKLR